MERPQLKCYLTLVPEAAGAWVVHGTEGEVWRLTFDETRRKVFERLVPLLTGEHRVDEIVARLTGNGSDNGTSNGDGIAPDQVTRLIDGLEGACLIEEAGDNLLPEDARTRFRQQVLFFSRFSATRDGTSYQRMLLDARADVLHCGGLSRAVLRQLAAAGIGTIRLLGEEGAAADVQSAIDDAREAAPETAVINGESLTRDAMAACLRDAGSTFLVVPLEAWDPGLLETVNEIALSTRKPWLLVQQRAAAEGLVGPLFVPGQTACYMCMEARLRTNTALFAEYDALQTYLKARGGPSRPWGGLNPNAEILAGMAASEVVKYLSGFAPPKLIGRFCAINWFTWGTELHDVLRQPRCPFCRPPRTEVFPWSEIPQPEPESEIAK